VYVDTARREGRPLSSGVGGLVEGLDQARAEGRGVGPAWLSRAALG
jgi:hypothetical protein